MDALTLDSTLYLGNDCKSSECDRILMLSCNIAHESLFYRFLEEDC